MKPSRGDASDPMLAVSSQLVVVVLHIYIGLIRSGVDSRAIGKLSANERDISSSFQIPFFKNRETIFVVDVVIVGGGGPQRF